MSEIVVRPIDASERELVLDLLAGWLNDRGFFARYFHHDPTFRDDLCFVALRRVVFSLYYKRSISSRRAKKSAGDAVPHGWHGFSGYTDFTDTMKDPGPGSVQSA